MSSGPASRRIGVLLVVLLGLFAVFFRPLVNALAPAPSGVRVVLWHSQRGQEREALEGLLREYNEQHQGKVYVEPLAVPDASFKDKILRSVPRGAGPDLFLRPHNELGEYVAGRAVKPSPPAEGTLPGLAEGLRLGGQSYGAPLTYKSLLVFYNTELLPAGPPVSLDEVRALRQRLPAGVYPLAYEANVFFFHAPLFLASGGHVFAEPDQRFAVFDDLKSFLLPGELRREGTLPPEPSYNEAIRLFESGKAATLICGPWYTPAGDVSDKWDVAPLFEVDGNKAGSFVTIEAAFISASSKQESLAQDVAAFLGSRRAQEVRFSKLTLPPVSEALYADPSFRTGARDELSLRQIEVQKGSLVAGIVTPTSTRMAAVWRPADDVLRASVAGRDVDAAVKQADYTLSRVADYRVVVAEPRWYGVALAALLVLGTMLVMRKVRLDVASPEAGRMRQLGFWGKAAVPYLAPGLLAVMLLVFAPVLTGALMSLFEFRDDAFHFVGWANFRELLFPPADHAFEARSFYFALAVTVVWTLLNVVLHVTLGVLVALLLRPAYVRFRTGFRLLLILPWAIPNYITALMWKAMFNAQVGAINALLAPFGFEGYAWFDRFHTAFFANLVTNTWLGFPFMMVVTLGAMSAIPKELEEAATLDGAGRIQRFVHIVLPHVRPALLPAVILGSVWTFNMFNVVYLVSGGEPGSQTDILISEAYRWAFERGQRYGYAAAYSVLIFGFLLLYSRLTSKLSPEEVL